MSDKFPEIDANRLLRGEGPMLKADSDGDVKVSKAEPSADGLPLVPIEAVAGFNGDDMPGVRLEDCLRYVVPEFAAAGAEYLIRISGSSMYPKYSSGDILACRRIPEIDFFQWGKIYVIDSSQGAMVKRIYQCEDYAACVLCKSDNDNRSQSKCHSKEHISEIHCLGLISELCPKRINNRLTKTHSTF